METVKHSPYKELWKTLKTWYELHLKSPGRAPLILLGTSLILTLALDWNSPSSTMASRTSSHQTPPTPAAIDTHIPNGYSLVPIEVQNADALNSIIGDFAIVDLFEMKDGRKARRVAQHVRLLRAPLDPSQFAVLLKGEFSQNVMGSPSALFVSVRNPKQTPPSASKKTRPLSRIIHESIAGEEL